MATYDATEIACVKRLLFSFLAILAIPLPSAFSQTEEVLYDGFRQIAAMRRNVRDVVEVDRTPLFENAPFLRLREKDKLLKAKEVREPGKPAADPDRISYYLLSGGVYYQLWTQEENGKLLLSPAFYAAECCLLFDWDLTLKNARALREILPDNFSSSLTRKQYEVILSAVRLEFPDIKVDFEQANPHWQPEQIISIPGQTVAEFQGLSYLSFENSIYIYWVRIGPTAFSIVGQRILQGPKHVERYEFEREVGDGPNQNSEEPDPKTAKIKRAEYDKMMKFRKLVRDSIQGGTR